MSVGKALLQIRRDQGLTQRAVGDRAGLAVSYVSRVENNHVQPTMGMLARLAAALEVPVASIFQVGERACTEAHKCPVSTSGNCIGELIRSKCGRVPNSGKAHYREAELQLLKMTDFIALHGSKDLQHALTTVLESFMLRASAEADGLADLPSGSVVPDTEDAGAMASRIENRAESIWRHPEGQDDPLSKH